MSVTFFTNYSTYFEGDSTSFDQTGLPSLIWVYVEATSTNPYYDYYSFGVSGDDFDSSDWVYRPADFYTNSDAIANNTLTANFPNNFGFYIKPSSDGVTEGTQSLTITAYYDRQKTMEVSSITINIADDNSGDDNIETFYQDHPVTLYGGLGSDIIKGNIKSDFLYGNEGNDKITGGLGNDEIYGGEGTDTAVFSNVDNTVNLGITTIQNTGEGWDYLSSIENINAGAGDDLITGNSSNNILNGEDGNDTAIFTGNENDYLITFGENNSSLIVQDLRVDSPDGTDTIRNIELIEFADQEVKIEDLNIQEPETEPVPQPEPEPEPLESGAVFTDRETLDIAIAAWIDNETSATEIYGDINTWDVSAITDFSALFQSQTTFNSDISNWDVSNGTSFYEVFQGATLFNQDIGDWDVSSGTNFDSIFERATSFNQDIGNWDVSNGNDFGEMLRDAIHFNQDIVGWDVSNGIDLTQMFQGATSFNQDVSTWQISEYANLRDMFLESDLMISNKGFNATPNFSDFNQGSEEIPDPEPEPIVISDGPHSITGTVKYWQEDKLLKDVNVEASYSKINVSSDGEVNFRDIIRDKENGTLSASLWVDSDLSNFENINFTFEKNNDAKFEITPNTELLNDDWLKQINDTDTEYSLSAVKIGNNNTGDVKIADVVLTLPSNGQDSAFLEWGKVGATFLEQTNFDQAHHHLSSNGNFALNDLDGKKGLYSLDFEKDPLTGIESRSIDSSDALIALKMSSGVTTSEDLTHNIQWMAADVDNNGLVQAKDAWLINNYVVGKTVANSQVGSWDFVDSLANFDNLGMSNTNLENENLNDIAFTDQSRTFNMTSFINGDVDGSFSSNLS